jgi:pimeloyl-ACP methyl ester carboxylesterase
MRSTAAEIPGFASGRASLNGVAIHYRVGGDPDGDPVLLWHGLLGTGYTWRKVAPALATAGRSVLVPDMRGFGDSDKPAGVEGYDAAALAEEFRALTHDIGFGGGRAITLVGHDWGAPPALMWAALHPAEVARVLYLDIPVLLQDVLSEITAFTPQAAAQGSLWWWLAALAPGFPESLVVGNERAFLEWFYNRASVTPGAIEPGAVNEYLRTFHGLEAVLGAFGVFRAVFASMAQTQRLTHDPVRVPVIGLGGGRSRGEDIGRMLHTVATHVETGVIADSGHFLPEEQPDALVRWILSSSSPSTTDRETS